MILRNEMKRGRFKTELQIERTNETKKILTKSTSTFKTNGSYDPKQNERLYNIYIC